MLKVVKERVIFTGNSEWMKSIEGESGLYIKGMIAPEMPMVLYLSARDFQIASMGLGPDQDVELVLRVVEEEQE